MSKNEKDRPFQVRNSSSLVGGARLKDAPGSVRPGRQRGPSDRREGVRESRLQQRPPGGAGPRIVVFFDAVALRGCATRLTPHN